MFSLTMFARTSYAGDSSPGGNTSAVEDCDSRVTGMNSCGRAGIVGLVASVVGLGALSVGLVASAVGLASVSCGGVVEMTAGLSVLGLAASAAMSSDSVVLCCDGVVKTGNAAASGAVSSSDAKKVVMALSIFWLRDGEDIVCCVKEKKSGASDVNKINLIPHGCTHRQ